MEREILLQVNNLNVQIGEQEILSSINLTANKGRILGIIGESGSGKSMLCQAIMQSIPAVAKSTGQILFQNTDLTSVTKERLRDYRGRQISMITQNPLVAFDSIQTIEMHFRESLKAHYAFNKKEIRQIAISAMNKVNLPNPEKLLQYYPFQLSGGMLQRVMIALSFSMQPKLYIADEPTTALDTVNQKKILTMFNQIRNETDAAIIIVTHNLGVIAELADEVAVMYKGELIEQANVFDFFDAPQHWYTKKLLQSRITY
ncbi:ABC transporter ATP-binding protein [Lysinibacillus sp. NPDC056959]|uniref:ABC transporter ATP-binding protein n=1 Tax=Lysinibacillus sp. NPDC056959 TaxID=3345981 RepID=UPI00363403A5